ncbi:MAG: 4Fe-4S dicluster domain-containing protein [Acidobacteriota bacterium]
MTKNKAVNEARRKKIDLVITWAPEYCKHCFTCINICPVDNLKFEGDEMVSLNKCIQCQLCMKYCPDFAIEVPPKKKPREKVIKNKAKSSENKASQTTKKSMEAGS